MGLLPWRKDSTYIETFKCHRPMACVMARRAPVWKANKIYNDMEHTGEGQSIGGVLRVENPDES